jgi:hypothetical protein
MDRLDIFVGFSLILGVAILIATYGERIRIWRKPWMSI